MAAKYFIKQGFVQGATDSIHAAGRLVKGLFDLRKWLKIELSYLGVSNFDPCCYNSTSNPQDPLNLPVRLNKTANKLQYLDNITGVWTNVVAAQIS